MYEFLSKNYFFAVSPHTKRRNIHTRSCLQAHKTRREEEAVVFYRPVQSIEFATQVEGWRDPIHEQGVVGVSTLVWRGCDGRLDKTIGRQNDITRPEIIHVVWPLLGVVLWV